MITEHVLDIHHNKIRKLQKINWTFALILKHLILVKLFQHFS